MSLSNYPEPPLPPDTDLRKFDWFPLYYRRLLDSAFWFHATGDVAKMSVNLWCKAWQQIPAASLPDDDAQLASWACPGMSAERWFEVRETVLAPWEKMSDGRLYHPVLVSVAKDALAQQISAKVKREDAKERKRRERERKAAKGKRRHMGQPSDVTVTSPSRHKDVTSMTGQDRTGQKTTPSTPPSASAAAPAAAAAIWSDRVRSLTADHADWLNLTASSIHHSADLRRLCEPANGAEPCDWDFDVIPAITQLAARFRKSGERMRSWSLVAEPAIRNRDRRLAGLPPVDPNPKGSAGNGKFRLSPPLPPLTIPTEPAWWAAAAAKLASIDAAQYRAYWSQCSPSATVGVLRAASGHGAELMQRAAWDLNAVLGINLTVLKPDELEPINT